MAEFVGEGLTYDDVLLVPQKASALPRDVSTTTSFCRGVDLQIPVSSAAPRRVSQRAAISSTPSRLAEYSREM